MLNRCKSYIHGSSDSYEAELEIAKHLSKYIIELMRIVNVNKATLEDQGSYIYFLKANLIIFLFYSLRRD